MALSPLTQLALWRDDEKRKISDSIQFKLQRLDVEYDELVKLMQSGKCATQDENMRFAAPYRTCPIVGCSAPIPESRCRCMNSDRVCENGHGFHWHYGGRLCVHFPGHSKQLCPICTSNM